MFGLKRVIHTRYFKEASRRACREKLRVFKNFRCASGEKPIFDFINELVVGSFVYEGGFFAGLAPEGYETRVALTFRQKLLRTTIDSDLSVGVMLMLSGRATHSYMARLPREWREVLADRGLRIHKLSGLFWLYTIAQKLKEAFSFYRIVGRSQISKIEDSPYALLLGLPPRSYAGYAHSDTREYKNFLSWFHDRYSYLRLHIVANYSPVEEPKSYVCFQTHTWPALDPQRLRIYKRQARKILGRSICAFARGQWQFAFIARDMLELLYVQSLTPAALPVRVAITNSHYVNRPLWSYYLEDCGIETGLYFYSTNTLNLVLQNGMYGQIYGYNLMSWSHYYTATPEHAAFIEEVTPYPKTVHVVGTIPLEDDGMPLPEKSKPVVAYFDVQPFRDAFMASIGRPTPVYFYEASRRNLEDLVAACKKQGFDLVLKPKRDVGKRLCPRYKRLLEALEARGDIKIIDSYIAADRVVAWADAVVSQPFTSVAIVAAEHNKPSVYYDGLGLFKKEQMAAQGIRVIQEQEELSFWLSQLDQQGPVQGAQ